MKAGSKITLPAELIEAVRQRKCAVLVGAGLSQGAGFPGWKQLLDGLITSAVKANELNRRRGTELRKILDRPDHYLMVAEDLYEALGREELKKKIGEKFLDATIQPTEAHRAIVSLPFSLAITTNYDQLLEISYARANDGRQPSTYTYSEATDFADALWAKRFFLLKAHGDAARSTSLILSSKDYRQLVRRAAGYHALMSAIFTTHTVLFLGASLDDPEVTLLLEYLHDSFHGGGQRHFALVPTASFSNVVAKRWLRDFRVDCIRYQATSGHPEVHEFLRELGRQCSGTES